MRFYVRLEVAVERELLPARGALVRSVAGVQQQVVLQVRLLAEAAVADVTAVGPGAAVDVHMRAEIAGRRERLGALRALVRLLLQHTMGFIHYYR